jgi:hypothetical protein
MIRRRLPLTAIISSSLIAGGLFMLDLPNTTEETHKHIKAPVTQTAKIETPTSVVPVVSVGSTAIAAIQAPTHAEPLDTIPESYSRTLKVGSGDTLMKILLKAGINRGDAHTAIEALRTSYDPRRLRPGQEIEVTFQPGRHEDMPHIFEAMELDTGFNKSVVVARATEGEYAAREEVQELTTTLHRAEGTIDSSLYVAATKAGIPAALLMENIFA